jgi:hypothetical protein
MNVPSLVQGDSAGSAQCSSRNLLSGHGGIMGARVADFCGSSQASGDWKPAI